MNTTGKERDRDLTTIVFGIQDLASAARDLIALTHGSSLARALAELESEIRGALDRDVPLFI